ncbi:SpaA isopeptide-forming pilin-related protein [Bifidobacterium choloepi]|uniref:Isopeptide-forming domain-containing fimbrial protein n=1 Tax=Bifidobacterium choloepi TaxID=2614131 RepID=A0A6I5NNV9_9BIFI|nr:SpaA isopeptide-forming pilin-related protein [Bifidobacterium choloepi]NEG70392.1 isopeptide-forming domain-containing fimbrial protein [Bifidobacterium choloepi]
MRGDNDFFHGNFFRKPTAMHAVSVLTVIAMTLAVLVGLPVDGKAYAAETTTDLSNMITQLKVNGQDVTNSATFDVTSGQTVTIEFTFAESNSYQFKNGAVLTYALPEGFVPTDTDLHPMTLEVTSDKVSMYGSTWQFVQQDDGTWVLEVTIADESGSLLDDWERANDAEFSIEATFTLSGSGGAIDLGGGKTVTFNAQAGTLTGTKNAWYDAETGMVTYTVDVTVKGDVTDVEIVDTMQGTVLSYNGDVTVEPAGAVTCSGDQGSSTITCTADSLSDGDTFTLTYTATLDKEAYAQALQENDGSSYAVSQANANTVTFTSDDNEGNVAEKWLPDVNISSSVSKYGTVASQDGSTYTIEWQATVNKEMQLSLGGTTITDTLAKGTLASDFTIVVTDENGTTIRTDDASSVTVSGNTFTYDVPEDDGNYTYTITYASTVDVKDVIGNVKVENTIETDYSQTTSSVDVSSDITVSDNWATKSGEQDGDTIVWTISVEVPSANVNSVTITDTLPFQSVTAYDVVAETPTVTLSDGTVLVAGTDYTYVPGEVNAYYPVQSFTIVLTEEGIQKAQGSTVTVTVTTMTVDGGEWTANSAHVNKAEAVIGDNDDNEIKKEPSASVTPKDGDADTSATKMLVDASGNATDSTSPAVVESDGMPVWIFRVMVDRAALANETIEVADVLGSLLEGTDLTWDDFELVVDTINGENYPYAAAYNDDYSRYGNNTTSLQTTRWVDGTGVTEANSQYFQMDDETGTLTIVFPQSGNNSVWPYWDGQYNVYPYAGIVYAIRPKSLEVLYKLIQLAADNDGTLTLTNTLNEDEPVEFTYQVDTIAKSLTTAAGGTTSSTEAAQGMTVTTKDDEYSTVWLFRVMMNEALIPEGGITLTDVFDTSLFKVLTAADFDDDNPMPDYLSSVYRFMSTPDGYEMTASASATDIGERITIDADGTVQLSFPDESSSWPDGNGLYVGYVYALVPVDDDALETIRALASSNDNFVAVFTNELSSGNDEDGLSTTVDFTFKEGVMTKDADVGNTTDRQVTFTLDVNPNALTVGSTGFIDIYDDMEWNCTDEGACSGLRFDPSSVTIVDAETGEDLTPLSDVDMISSSYVKFTVPDSRHITITYVARMIGQSEKKEGGSYMSFANTASLLGYESSYAESDVDVSSSQSGTAATKWMKLLKYENGDILEGLAGATFALYETDTNGNPTGEPLATGTTLDDGVLWIGIIPESYGMKEEDVNTLWPAEDLYANTLYALVEIEAPDGYELDSTPILFKMTADGDKSGSETWFVGATMAVENHKGALNIRKVSSTDTSTRLANATLCIRDASITDLSAALGEDKTLADLVADGSVSCATTGADGLADFGSISAGNYILWEQSAPSGYLLSGTEYAVTVTRNTEEIYDGDGNVSYEYTYETTVDGLDKETTDSDNDDENIFVLTNQPIGPLSVYKVDDADTSVTLEGAVFCVEGDNQEKQCMTTEASGWGSFSSLDPGLYWLWEETAPKGYEPIPGKWILYVDENGVPWIAVFDAGSEEDSDAEDVALADIDPDDLDLQEVATTEGVGYTFKVANTKSDNDDADVTLPNAGWFNDGSMWIRSLALAGIMMALVMLDRRLNWATGARHAAGKV